MKSNPLDAVLEKLSGGDAAAAEQVFLAYEPYLRMVVRRQLPPWLRPKFDSVDIVQSVWADLLDGFRGAGWRFRDADHLRAFLVQVTRNRFIDRYRQNQQAVEHERPLEDIHADQAPAAADPRPSQLAQTEELWQQMLALCPPEHHELLRLKRQGYSLEEVAARTGMHASSVRRILYSLARRLARRQQASAPAPGAEP